MKFLKKLAAITAAAAAIFAMSATAFSEELAGFDFAPAGGEYKYYDFTAEDGASGQLCFTVDDEGKLYFSSYKINAPEPKSSDDFPDAADSEGNYIIFEDAEEFYDYVEKTKDELRYLPIVEKFDVSFDPPSNYVIRMYGGKCYIADLETKTVNYAGFYALNEEAASDYVEPQDVCEFTAEDGAKFYIYFDKDDGKYIGYEAEENVSNVDYAYSTDENSRIIISSIVVGEVDTGYTLYSNSAEIPLADNEVLAEIDVEQYVEDESGRLAAVLNIKKYYVITIDGMYSTVRYAGCSYSAVDMYSDFEPSPDSDWSDGATVSPKTGSGGNFFAVMLAAAGLAVLAKCAKK